MATLREELEGAWAAKAEGLEPEATAPPEPTSEGASTDSQTADSSTSATPEPAEAVEPKPDAADTARDEKGKFLPKGKAQTPAKAPSSAPVTPTPSTKGQQPAPVAVKPLEAAKAKRPSSWGAAVQDKWDTLPSEIQQQILKRERDVTTAMSKAVENGDFREKFETVARPYSGLLKSQGWEPLALAENLFQTYGALHLAPAAQKAGLIANLISQFGVDPNMVGAHLQGQPIQQQAQQFDPNQLRQQLKQEIMGDFEHQQMSAIARHEEAKLSAFEASHEFLDDLREPMAKLLEAKLADDFEDAYAKAAAMHPEVSRAMQQREEAKQAKAQQASTQRSRAASSSLRSTPAGPSSTSQSRDLRSVLERAYDERSGQSR